MKYEDLDKIIEIVEYRNLSEEEEKNCMTAYVN